MSMVDAYILAMLFLGFGALCIGIAWLGRWVIWRVGQMRSDRRLKAYLARPPRPRCQMDPE